MNHNWFNSRPALKRDGRALPWYAHTPMRSPKAFAGALILLLGVVLAIAAGMTLDGAASPIIHAALGISFLLFALAAFDFRTPGWITWPASLAIGALGLIFLIQGASDVLQNPALDQIAYQELGQRFEKLLGYVFIAWCLAVALLDARGATKAFGLVVIAAVIAVEAYGWWIARNGLPPTDAWKLVDLGLFVWLLLEARKSRAA